METYSYQEIREGRTTRQIRGDCSQALHHNKKAVSEPVIRRDVRSRRAAAFSLWPFIWRARRRLLPLAKLRRGRQCDTARQRMAVPWPGVCRGRNRYHGRDRPGAVLGPAGAEPCCLISRGQHDRQPYRADGHGARFPQRATRVSGYRPGLCLDLICQHHRRAQRLRTVQIWCA
jgi:hypothetical protein